MKNRISASMESRGFPVASLTAPITHGPSTAEKRPIVL